MRGFRKIKMLSLSAWTIWSIAVLVSLPSLTTAQPAKIPFIKEPYFIDSGLHDGLTGLTAGSSVAFRDVLEVPGVPWLRLQFHAFNLGEMDSIGANVNDSTMVVNDSIRSYITITSLEDGGKQILDAISLKQWGNTSAYFNGDAVEIELHVAPGDKEIFFEINELMVGMQIGDSTFGLGKTLSLCGSDNRTSSNDYAVGRVLEIIAGDTVAQCSGWIVSNGAHLTAGHCAAAGVVDILEFNVPASEADGTPNFADPDDQYAVNQGSIDYYDDGPGYYGNDWAVFDVYPNSNTELLPVQAQQAFYRMSRDSNPEAVRVTGFGVDGGTANQTQQTDSGDFLDEDVQGSSDVVIEYIVDTRGGNSGSPVIIAGSTLTVGIHTNAGCNPPNQGNTGTGFENDDLENAIQNFPGSNAKYVDKAHPIVSEDGSVLRPYDTVAEGVSAITSGGILSIVTRFL